MSGAWNEVPTKSHSSGMLRIQMAWMILKFVTYCVVKKFGGTVTGQIVLQNTPHDKCGRECTARIHIYASMYQALHRSLGPQRYERLYVMCDQMGQADTGVHLSRDENSTPYEAVPGPKTPISPMADRCFGVKYRLAL